MSAADRSIAASTAWGITGQVVPALVALVAIPVLLRDLGGERFAVLGFAWALIGYLGLFDLGLGRAVTRFAAEALGGADTERFRAVAWTGWLVLAATGVLLAVVGALAAGPTAERVLRFSTPALAAEGGRAFVALALALPAVVLTAGLRGVLEASGHFREVNLLRIPFGALTFLAPVALLPLTTDVAWLVTAVSVSRLFGAAAHFVVCLRLHPVLARGAPPFSGVLLREMLVFGGWITVSSVVSPLMVSLDRFVVGAMVSMAAAAAYVTPFELATRVLMIPAAFSAVLFPRVAARRAEGADATEADRGTPSYAASLRVVALTVAPVVVAGILLADVGLRLWVGPGMAQQSAPALRWLLVGVLTNALAHIPFAWLQGRGRADLTAKAHLIEAPVHLSLLVVLVPRFGVAGAAMAWSARTTLDLVLLHGAHRRLTKAGAAR